MTKSALPLVSIVMPCLNAEKTIEASIWSVVNQTYENFELIVVDDGSNDSTVSIVQNFIISDSRIILLQNYTRKGVSIARNIGINATKGKYICFLDSDDLLTIDSIKLRVTLAEEKSVDIIFGSYHRLYENGSCSLVVPPDKINYKDMLKKNYIGNLTGFYNVITLGKRLQKNVKHEDYLMWIHMLRDVEFAYSAGCHSLGVYRVSNSSLSGNKFKAFHWHWIILRKELNLPFIRSGYYQLYYLFSSLFVRLF